MDAPAVEERIPVPVAASLPVLARAGYEGPSPSVVGQKLVSSAEQRCIVPRSAGRAAFGVEEVNAAGPRLTSGLVPSDMWEKPKLKEHPASAGLLQGGKCSCALQLWVGVEPGWRSPIAPWWCHAWRSPLAPSPGCPPQNTHRALEAIYVLSARSQKQFNLGWSAAGEEAVWAPALLSR